MNCVRYLDNIVWELTLRCNAKCSHCGSSAGIDRKDNLSNEEILRLCDELGQLGCREAALIGGEAFLHPLWREIVKKLRSLNIMVSIVTNAMALNEEKIEFLAQNNLNTLGISLDGASAEVHDGIRRVTGIFKHIFSLSELIKQSKIQTTAITTVTKRNILELPKLMKLLPTTFFGGWQLQIGTPFGRLNEDSTSLSELEYYITGIFVALMQIRYKNRYFIQGMHDLGYYSNVIPNSVNTFNKDWAGCPAGRHVMGIRSNGKVSGCLSIYDDNYIDGDVREKSLADIWNDKNFCAWNQKFNKYKNLRGYCKKCVYAAACCAGCSGMAIAFYGDEKQNKLCYHKIEQEYKKYDGGNQEGTLLSLLVNGKISDDGHFEFADKQRLTENFVDKLSADAYLKDLLSILL